MSRLNQKQQLGKEQPPITFGIELEGRFLAHTEQTDVGAVGPSMNLAIMAKLLQERSGLDVQEARRDKSTYSAWELTTDFSILQIEGEGMPFELRSPVLNVQTFFEIATIITALHELGRVFTDGNCGMHVHCGFSEYGFNLRTLQNVAAIVSGYEHIWKTLHETSRQDNIFCMNPSRGFMTSEGGEIANLTSHAQVATIFLTTHYQALRNLLIPSDQDCRNRAYNFLPVCPTWMSEYTTKTIEFRQHASTFDNSSITAWVITCIGIVEYSSQATDFQLQQLFSHMDEPEQAFGAAELLSAMGLDFSAAYYQPARLFPSIHVTERPTVDGAGAALIQAAIAMRPQAMRVIEAKRNELGHLKIEQAVLQLGPRFERQANVYVPFTESPYSMPYKELMNIAPPQVQSNSPTFGSSIFSHLEEDGDMMVRPFIPDFPEFPDFSFLPARPPG